LRDQVDEILIVDNGSSLPSQTILHELRNDPKVTVTYLPENLGIAAALNIGARYAQSAGYEWLATFDQDSQASPMMIATMLQAYAHYPTKEQVASLSPRYQNQPTGQIVTSRPKTTDDITLPYVEVSEVVTSGNLLKLSIFKQVGGFNESLFIDYVDTEFCLRCALNGYQILEVKDAYLLHHLGNSIHISIFGKVKTVTNHNSLRRYYIARNAVYLYKNWFFKNNKWVRHDSLKLLKTIAMVCFEQEKTRKLSAMLRGVIDGLRGKMGPLKSSI
jgi:rhamnosyltransferase